MTRPAVLLGLPLLVLADLAAPPPASACCMVPRGYAGDVDQSSQDVLVCHHDGHQELVIRVRPFFRDAEEAPGSLAWLVTVPSTPTGYRTADPEVFGAARALHRRLEDLLEAQRPKPLLPSQLLSSRAVASAAGDAPSALSVGETVSVGPYEITPVKAAGAAAVDELNRYLDEHGFGAEDPGHLRWFAEHDFTFLCIRITPPPGSVRLGKHLDLVPLQIGFDCERPYYPGMYSANQGNFGLELTTLTTRPLARASAAANARRLSAFVGEPNLFTTRPLPEPFAAAVERALPEGASEPERWYVNRYDSRGFNPPLPDGRPSITSWTEDVTWELGSLADAPPSWYYGDGSRPLLHPNNVRAVLLGLMVAVLLLLAVWAVRRSTRAARA